jgi:PAS domain S-box-containing protein
VLQESIPNLNAALSVFIDGKKKILEQWMHYDAPREILEHHGIDCDRFVSDYAGHVFDYFMAVIRSEMEIGDCPVMSQLLLYLKDRDVSADELFIICSHFRKSMLDFSYDSHLNNKAIFDEISYVFDLNFSGLLKRYTDTIYQKEREIERNVRLLSEYKKAIDESAIVSKTDLNGLITYANDNFCDVSGYSREELVGKSHNIIRHPDMPSEFFEELWRTIRKKRLFKGTIKNRNKDGDYFYVDQTIVPITDSDHGVTEYMAIGYEVTKLIDARQKALDAGQAKDYFLSNMSHEIRTPLNAILGFVSLMQDEVRSPKQKKYLDIIRNSGENLLSIINDILDFSKLRSGEFTVDPRPFNLHEELTHTLELFVASANEKEITMLSFIDPHIPYEMVADPLRIKQIVANFLSNAIKFTPYRGVVEVEAGYRDKMLSISVKDNGIGISETEQVRIFDAFSQAQNGATRVAGGTGLGLSICKQLAEHMNGTVEVESKVGEGSRFTLRLPVHTTSTTALHMFDPSPFKKLRLGILQNKRNGSRKLESLRRYLQAFELDAVTVNRLEEERYDLFFFADADVDEPMRLAIAAQPLPSIAVMEYFDDRYDTAENITPLYFPIYCSKLYNTFLEALHISLKNDAALRPEAAKQRRFSGHVLVAEDNIANQELIKIMLERYGLSFYIASDGVEAVAAFKRADFDLVLMDEQMPRKNGLQATQEILAYEAKQGMAHTPIAALTANVIKGAKERGLTEGYDAFLGKPIVIKEIEKIFGTYLKELESEEGPSVLHNSPDAKITGIDAAVLQKELMLDHEQLLMLVETFSKKMAQSLPDLLSAIESGDLQKVGRLAHAIKGSSANFRLKALQKEAAEMEQAAGAGDREYDYAAAYTRLHNMVKKIGIEKKKG